MTETIKFLAEKARRLEELSKESTELSQNIQAVFTQMLAGQELEDKNEER